MNRHVEPDQFVRRFRLQLRPFGGHVGSGAPYGELSRIRTGMSTEQLLQRLNGHVVAVDGQSWQIDVYSIVDNDAHRWVQVGLNGPDRRTVLLRLEYLADDEDALTAIDAWIRHSSSLHGGMVTVSDTD